MNDKQIEWTLNKCDELKNYMESRWPVSEAQRSEVVDYIGKVVELSKGNAEVRNTLFDLVEAYQKKAEEMLKIGN